MLEGPVGPVGAVVRRRRQAVARPRSVLAKFSEAEFAVLGVAAAQAGLTPTGYVAARAVAVARGEVQPLPSDLGEAVLALVEARTALVRYGVVLNQVVAAVHSSGVVDRSLVEAVARCDEAAVSVRAATERLGRQR